MSLLKFIVSMTVVCLGIIGIGHIVGRFSAPGTVLDPYGGYVIWVLLVFVLVKSLFTNLRSSS